MYRTLFSSYISGQPQNSQLFEEKQDQTLTRMKIFLLPFFPSLSSFSPSSLPSSLKHPEKLSGCCVVSHIFYDLQITKSSWRQKTHTTMYNAQSSSQNVLYTLTILSLLFIISYNIHTKCKSMLRHPERDQMPRVSNKNSSAGNQWHFAVLNLTW